jgi:hypothetical protein
MNLPLADSCQRELEQEFFGVRVYGLGEDGKRAYCFLTQQLRS